MAYPEGSAEALQLAGKLAEAAEGYESRLRDFPADARTLSNYGGLLNLLNRFDEALVLLSRAVEHDPSLADAWSNIGNSFLFLSQYENAIACYRNSLRLDGRHALALSNMGVALDHRGDHTLALQFHRAAITADPDNSYSRTNYAVSLLQDGQYPEGFKEYEHRWTAQNYASFDLKKPRWLGEDAPERVLLISTEGGFGDVIQFARFAPLAARRVGRVLFRVRRELVSLLKNSLTNIVVLSEDDEVPPHDLECPVLSLPHALGITLETLPGAAGYLEVEPEKAAFWRNQLVAEGTNNAVPPLRVGVVWAGAPHPEVQAAFLADRRRSTDLDTFASLATLPGVVFYSLQLGEKADQSRTPPPGMRLIDHTSQLRDFSDTAALVSALDLIIAVDTSTCHLAAALGKPTWLLSRYDQCWRWLSRRTDSPWYDTVRIFQQSVPLDWSMPMVELHKALSALILRHEQCYSASL
ncbi:tetratricopeptide repeat-containing glycosyltransferase family protein [Asaia sp. HN010]|uniref:tetratricopeptide repeat-containing glycosyltransferase family protein n=1 Tax=Asaia sp. HN010 TaxID=3081233 RepID=UPI00301B6977